MTDIVAGSSRENAIVLDTSDDGTWVPTLCPRPAPRFPNPQLKTIKREMWMSDIICDSVRDYSACFDTLSPDTALLLGDVARYFAHLSTSLEDEYKYGACDYKVATPSHAFTQEHHNVYMAVHVLGTVSGESQYCPELDSREADAIDAIKSNFDVIREHETWV